MTTIIKEAVVSRKTRQSKLVRRVGTAGLTVIVGLLAMSAPAPAITVKGSTTDVMIHVTKPTQSVEARIRSEEGRSVVPLIEDGTLIALVDAGATGQGPASQEDCDSYADMMNNWADLMNVAAADNQWDAVSNAGANFAEEHEEAVSQGCFVVFSRRSEEPPPPE